MVVSYTYVYWKVILLVIFTYSYENIGQSVMNRKKETTK